MADDPSVDELVRAIEPVLPFLKVWWLDSGALLGMVRAGGLMGWDSDIDLGIWDDAVDDLVAALPTLRRQGFRVSMRSYRGRVYGFTIENKALKRRPVHIHAFYRDGERAWSPQTVTYAPVNRPNGLVGFQGSGPTRNALLWVKRHAIERRKGPAALRAVRWGVFFPLWGALTVARNRLERQHWASVPPLSHLHATYTWIVPAHHFLRLDTLDINGIAIPVPSQVEGYLARRYGEWRTPARDWCYWTDDGCIVPLVPEAALRAAERPAP